ncbi:putative transcription factor HD-ZIP family [Helianthus annuus]|uniref:Putative leucine zipper, homeobox-associated, HD-ZIP protein, Homeodomain-like protein n=1 Tax=Helianthus annuus TaxID=4232 RepID=A0A251VCU6_HELAN|nr:homeobox-leucine zipper protein HAT3 [Helianthus annuus]KAJ0603290.1 putative transcription factor HD-ZIP family [Helianthus annuus]KAJ0945971.1 putative transcription factor HD-ZIP family [Helianthus annuus]
MDDGLGLSLSLKCSKNHPAPPPPPQMAAGSNGSTRFPLNLLHSPPFSFVQRDVSTHQKLPFIISPPDLNLETRRYARGIDGNRLPSTLALTMERDDEALVSSPNSTVSSVSGKRVEREENEAERESSSHGSGDDDDDGGEASAARKKLRLSKDQAAVLEETFKEHNTLNPKQKLALAKQLDLRPRQVEVWFQNRRARTKLKQTEVDCEYLKRCCDTLTEENRRLQKEVNELRALKLSPQFYMNMNPPTTLTMCPQCERVAVSSSSSSSSSAATTSSTLGSTNLSKGLHGSMAANHQKQNNLFLPRASVIPQRPLDTHHLGGKIGW